MQSYYSFYGSPLHLILEDEIAESYNRVSKNMYESNGNVLVCASDADIKNYSKVADIINKLIEINGGLLEIAEEEMPLNYLVKL